MSDELFEVAFSGQIVDGTNPEEVKARVGKMFKANEAKIAALFSGKRVVIKKNIDQKTATKYKAALYEAGAISEIKSMSDEGASTVTPPPPKPEPAPAPKQTSDISIETGEWGEVEPPPQVDPLGITGDQIEDLDATLAPVGSAVRDKFEETPEPEFDLTEFNIAPVGSDIGSAKKDPEPPPPDTNGITLAD